MNRLGRSNENQLSELLRQVLRNWQSGLWTALPCIVQSYDATKQICTAQPTIQLQRYLRDGTVQPIDLPLLIDVPVIFPGGGGYTLTFPVAKGDEALVVFASRQIDVWWAKGVGSQKSQPQTDYRMHDLSDGFAIIGPRNQTRMLSPNPSGNSVQLRSDDGQAVVEIAANHIVNVNCVNANVTASNTATVKAVTIKLQNAGTALKKLVMDSFITLFNAHTHTVTAVGSPTSPPGTLSTTDTTTVVSAE